MIQWEKYIQTARHNFVFIIVEWYRKNEQALCVDSDMTLQIFQFRSVADLNLDVNLSTEPWFFCLLLVGSDKTMLYSCKLTGN